MKGGFMTRQKLTIFLIYFAVFTLILGSSVISLPQTPVRNRIASAIERTPSAAVRGHVHPLARARYDRGKVAGLFAMSRVTMVFKPTAGQQAELNTLLQQQQDPSSPNYHRWLTPAEFADRFGLSTADLNNTVTWLQDQGFTIDDVSPGRNWIAFSGFARQMESAFQTRIHEYAVNGETHFASANEPSVPKRTVGAAGAGKCGAGFPKSSRFQTQTPRNDPAEIHLQRNGQPLPRSG
jgi:hypothetical protein